MSIKNVINYYLFKPMPLDDFGDYDEYWRKRETFDTSLHRAKLISLYIKEDKRILDIGCGNGGTMKYLNEHNKPAELIGVDISKVAVEYARKRGLKALKMDIFSSEFKKFLQNNTFDYILINEVIEHVQSPETILREINLTQKNIRLFISIPNAGFILNRLRFLLGRFPLTNIKLHIKEHIRFWTYKDFLYWIDKLGFKVIDAISPCQHMLFGFDVNRLNKSLFTTGLIYVVDLK